MILQNYNRNITTNLKRETPSGCQSALTMQKNPILQQMPPIAKPSVPAV